MVVFTGTALALAAAKSMAARSAPSAITAAKSLTMQSAPDMIANAKTAANTLSDVKNTFDGFQNTSNVPPMGMDRDKLLDMVNHRDIQTSNNYENAISAKSSLFALSTILPSLLPGSSMGSSICSCILCLLLFCIFFR